MSRVQRIAFIGFGEAGGILGRGLAEAGVQVRMHDLLLDDPAARQPMLDKAAASGVQACATLAEAVAGAELVVSAVTAARAADAARAAGLVLRPGQVFIDINSVSPGTKAEDRRLAEAGGAAYVEAAVMAPVPPYGIGVPMLLGGAAAAEVAAQLGALGMNARAIATEIGVASAIKMCRSVMIKGLEALTVECMSAARRFGAEDAVLASLAETFPGMGWTGDLPGYLISRVAEHGRRRAAEMREVAATLREVGIEPRMSEACAVTQDAFTDALRDAGLTYDRERPFDWPSTVDRLAQAGAAPSRPPADPA
jgi:3-hydroxyisobutyrate dehydrogenase-like beta-hydroxyacid dehydrogenase